MHLALRIAALAGFFFVVVSAGDDALHYAYFSVEDLAGGLVEFYAAVGQHEKVPSQEKAVELLEMQKWKGKEMKLFQVLQKKYAEEEPGAVKNLEEAFRMFTETETKRLQTKLAHMRLQKEVLEGINKITTVIRTLMAIGTTAAGMFEDVKQSAEEGNRLLDSINDEESWEAKLELVNQGLSKRSQWIEQLMIVKEALSAGEQEAGNEDAVKNEEAGIDVAEREADKTESDKPGKHEMDDPVVMERTAKVMVQAVREGKHDMVVKLMSILEKKPEILAKLVMWADERTGANLLHWCAFYGKEVHVALTQSFMMVPGVNASVADQHHLTPCHTACKKNHSDVLQHLMAQHASSSSTPCDPFALGSGTNCLHVAAQGGFTQILELLAPRLTKDTLEMVSDSGVSAAALAGESGSAEAVKLLDQAAKRLLSKASDEL